MAVTTTTRSVSYTASGAETSFAVPFRFLEDSHLVVTLDGVAQTQGVDYTVQGAGGSSGSVVPTTSFNGALVITRVVPLTQAVTFRSQGSFAPAVHEAAIDLAAMAAQQLDADRAALEVQQAADVVALAAARQAGDAAVTAWAAEEIAAARGTNPYQAIGDASTVLATGTTTSRTLAERFKDTINVKDFGAVGDGSADDTDAVQAALNAYMDGPYKGRTIYFPAGEYKVTSQLLLTRPYGGAIVGDGTWSTSIAFRGTGAPTSVLKLYNPRSMVVRDMAFVANTPLVDAPDALVELAADGDGISPFTPSGVLFENVAFEGVSCTDYGVKVTYATPVANWNDQHGFFHCTFNNILKAGFYQNSPNAKNQTFVGCLMSGGECGIHNERGSFTWNGGFMSGHTISNFLIGEISDACVVTGMGSEASARLLSSSGGVPGNGAPFTFDAIRYATGALHADGFVIHYFNDGPLILRGCEWGTWNSPGLMSIKIESGSSPPCLILDGCTWGAPTAAGTYPIWTAAQDTYVGRGNVQIRGCLFLNGSLHYEMGPVPEISADRGDASATLDPTVDAPIQRWATALTANRTVTLTAPGARGVETVKGDKFKIVRTGLGAFTLDVGGLKTLPSATAAWAEVTFDGSAWVLTGYGTL